MKPWVIHSRTAFEATHALTVYKGEPEAPHAHTWEVAIAVGADALNAEGYALDFHAVHRALADAVAPLHGADLNRHPEIGRPTPTAERVAQVLAEILTPRLEALGGALQIISVWEGRGNRVDYHLTS